MSELNEYLNQIVVIDTKSSYIFIGSVESFDQDFITLKEVDVHDHNNYPKSKELYIIESVKYGLKPNRKRVKIVRNEVISISLLTDVLEY